ncbi:MAG: PTS fructose transporter subunit IIC, partial [Firmicutes bacterium]|nr:PTS fructose transporter subunit IIC [Bacillota bacterium]
PAEEAAEAVAVAPAETGLPRVLAVTACPTGIAHTYMAAEALNQKAEEMGISIKVETNGSGGAKNLLTAEEIAAAEGIIVAADKQVAMARFAGKKVYKTKVADGINKPEELINKALSDSCPVYEASAEAAAEEAASDNESIGRKIYKSLMNGVSYMLPFVIGGGIMIALAFLIDTIAGAPRDGDFGTYTALAAFFKGAGGIAFNFMLPVLAGFIAQSIGDRPAIAVGFTGGSMAAIGCTFAAPGGDGAAVSGFLGALLAGFVGGLIVKMLQKAFEKAPDFVQRMMPVLIIPLLGITLMAVVMFAVNPIIGMLNSGLTNGLASMGDSSAVLLGMIVAGMMAVDMGGPFNKAAYVFGVGMLASGNYSIMAAVMIGGMIPPIAIALATTFFKNRWTDTELKSGPVNYIMGLCFITEGAIPYAAADPLRVIPSCIVGSALGGALSMLFGCELMAPHGGIFVFPVVTNVFGYLIALVAGAAAGMLMLAILKKKQPQA